MQIDRDLNGVLGLLKASLVAYRVQAPQDTAPAGLPQGNHKVTVAIKLRGRSHLVQEIVLLSTYSSRQRTI
jgi:hypothetical protein